MICLLKENSGKERKGKFDYCVKFDLYRGSLCLYFLFFQSSIEKRQLELGRAYAFSRFHHHLKCLETLTY